MVSPEIQLETLHRRIEAAGDILDSDRDAFLAFDDAMTLLNSNYSTYRHAKRLRHGTILAERVGDIDAALTDRDTAEDIVRWNNRNYDNEETDRDYRVRSSCRQDRSLQPFENL